MTSCSDALENVLIKILSEHIACIAHEINDRAYYEYEVLFESFVKLREIRDKIVSEGIVKEKTRRSPYGKPFKFYYLTEIDSAKVNHIIKTKYMLLFKYAKHTCIIGRFGENLVAKSVEKLGFTKIKVRKRLGKKDVDVWCKDRSEKFYWAIECKNRRQEIDKDDITDALDKTELAASKWNVKDVKAAIVSSSIYDRIPEEPSFPIVRTGKVYVPNEKLFCKYKDLLGAWYLEPVSSVPNDLIELIDKLLK